MIRNYLTVAVRSLIRDRLYSAISIAGLAIGMACSLLIVLYVIDELSYDTHHPNSDRIYSVIREGKRSDGSDFYTRGTVGALGRELKADFPEVESIVRTWVRTRWVRHEGEEFILLLKGILEVHVDDEHFVLKEGDSLHYHASNPHRIENIGEGPCEAWVVTVPSFKI